jgi:polar amino acid transport system substrate-binding protein
MPVGGVMKKLLAAFGLAGLAAVGIVSSAQNMAKYGDCTIYGSMGKNTFTPAIAGQLTVQTNLPSPGFYNGDSPETIKSGVEYCMAANIAHRAGLEKVVVQNVAWDGLVAGKTRKFDLALSQISITEERKKYVDFSIPYYSSDTGVMVRKNYNANQQNIVQLRAGVQLGTTAEQFASKKLKIRTVKVFSDSPSMFIALRARQIDVVLTDTSIILDQIKQNEGIFEIVGQYKTGESYGAIFPKNNKNNVTINNIIKEIINDKTVAKLVNTYLSQRWGMNPQNISYWSY